jgi:NAD(P)H-dependent flavin oxidoreductase YrpB (nitropropane dioxygenase family)
MHDNLLGTKYPLLAVAMNQVSDANLAIAVRRAGGLPSISIFNYADHSNNVNYELLENEIVKYSLAVGDSRVVLSVDPTVIDDTLINFVRKFKISHLELIPNYDYIRSTRLQSVLSANLARLQALEVTIILKVVVYPEDIKYWSSWNQRNIDIISLKGPQGAGRVSLKNDDLIQLIKKAVTEFDIPIIAVGGIHTSDQVKELLAAGASAVGVGTLFAASTESCLSIEAKMKLVSAEYDTLSQLPTIDLPQNALVLSKMDPDDLENNSIGLIAGVTTGNTGHVFAGQSVNGIKKIDTVQNIIEELFK